MSKHKIYAEAHILIAKIVETVDTSELDEITGDPTMEPPSDEVLDAMYSIARNHRLEAKNLEAEEIHLQGIHGNLVAPKED